MRKDGYKLSQCIACSLVYVDPQPTQEYLRTKVYSTESGFQAGRAENLSTYTPSKRYGVMCDMLLHAKPRASLLDVGAGGGHFMYHAQKNGFSVAGVELNTRLSASARAQGFTMYDGTLAEAPIAPHSFDSVVLGEVIEHVNEPRQLVRDAARVLKPDGILLITTPNLDCFWSRATFVLWKLFRIPWSSCTPPYHLFQFSVGNLDTLLAQEGFIRTDARYLPPPALRYELGSLHLLKRFKRSRNPLDALYMFFAFALYVPLWSFAQVIHPVLAKDFSMLHVYRRGGVR